MPPLTSRENEIRLASMAAHKKAERMVARAGVDIDPIEHLLDALRHASALACVWGEMVAALDASAPDGILRGALGYHEDVQNGELRAVSDDPLIVLDRSGMAKVHPFVGEHNTALERWAKLAKLAVDAGVSERQIAINEQQGQLIAQVVNGVLAELGVGQHPNAPAVVRRHLALVSGAGA